MAKQKSKAKRENVKLLVDREFQEMTAGAALRPSTVVPMACPMCATWVEANLVHHSSVLASDTHEEAGILYELTFFAKHSCVPPLEAHDVDPD